MAGCGGAGIGIGGGPVGGQLIADFMSRRIPTYVVWRIRQEPPLPCVVKESTPVIAFGNLCDPFSGVWQFRLKSRTASQENRCVG